MDDLQKKFDNITNEKKELLDKVSSFTTNGIVLERELNEVYSSMNKADRVSMLALSIAISS